MNPDHDYSPAVRTVRAWLARCGTPSGGDNLFYVDGVLHSIHTRAALANGGLRGNFYRQPKGSTFIECGTFHIGAKGDVISCPAEIRAALEAERRQPGGARPGGRRSADPLRDHGESTEPAVGETVQPSGTESGEQ